MQDRRLIMLLKTSEIIGRKIDAADGEIGKIMDIYFDDKSWGP